MLFWCWSVNNSHDLIDFKTRRVFDGPCPRCFTSHISSCGRCVPLGSVSRKPSSRSRQCIETLQGQYIYIYAAVIVGKATGGEMHYVKVGGSTLKMTVELSHVKKTHEVMVQTTILSCEIQGFTGCFSGGFFFFFFICCFWVSINLKTLSSTIDAGRVCYICMYMYRHI